MTGAGYFLEIAIGLIIMGVVLLAWSIIQQLPPGAVRSRWRILSGLIFIFIAGYILYALLHRQNGFASMADLVVPGIFFSGAIFVFLVCSLSLTTTHDLRQMYILEQKSITDCLMGIYNRRYLERRLAEEIQRARRYELPFSIFLLDIDHFKKINDTYGHEIGDRVLKKLGAAIVESVREMDVVIRYGGEEILVILPNTEEKNAFELADRLRRKIAGTNMVEPDPEKGRPAIYLTVSIGVAGYRFADGWDTDRRMLERADKAMYRAKQHGRNWVMVSEQEVEPV